MQYGEPYNIVKPNHASLRHQRIDQQTPCHTPQALPLGEVAHRDIEEGNTQPIHDKTSYEAAV